MALFSSLFKGRGEKKEEPKAPPAPAASPMSSQPVWLSPLGKTAAGKTVPGAPQNPMQFDEIVAALQQIDSIMAEPMEATPAEAAVTSDHLETIALGLGDVKQLAPSSFNEIPVALGDKADVVIDNLFSQMSKGKIQTTLGNLLAGVPKQYLVNPADLKSEACVSLPLPLIVAAVDLDDLKKHTGTVPNDPLASKLPNLFRLASDAPAKPETFTSLRLKLADLKFIMPSAFKSAVIPPDARVDVPVEDIFGQLAKGKVEVPVNKLLAGVPKQYISLGAKLDAETRVVLPLSVIVTAIPPDELKKRTAEQPAKPMARDLPDLFQRADTKEEPKPAEIANPTDSTIPVPKAASEVAQKVEPKDPPIPEAKPAPQPKAIPEPELRIESRIEPSPAPNSEFKAAAAAPKVEKQMPSVPVAPATAPVRLSDVPVLLLRGLDLNQVSAEELMRVVNGIGESMARRIVEDRAQNGPFFGLYDLGRVPGIGSKIYEKITGQPWLEEKYGQLTMVDKILGRWTGRHPDLKDVAAKFKVIPGFEGCAILHRDGHLLATSWQVESPDRLQAMAPQILKKAKHYMRHIVQGEMYSVTLFLEGFSFTFVESEDICFVAVHNPKGLSHRHIQVVNGLGVALGRRFSGYRGA